MGGRPTYDSTVAEIMALGGFQVKMMVRSGEQRAEVVELLGGGVLGLPWDTAKDAISLHLGVNLSPKIRKMRTGLELKPHELDRIASLVNEKKLTKREVVSII